MSKYRHIIFDADHTLIDFNADEKRAFYAAFQGTPLEREETVQHMWEYSLQNWGELGLNEVNDLPPLERRAAKRRAEGTLFVRIEINQRVVGIENNMAVLAHLPVLLFE